MGRASPKLENGMKSCFRALRVNLYNSSILWCSEVLKFATYLESARLLVVVNVCERGRSTK